MSLKQDTAPSYGPWLLTVGAIWVLILFLKSVEPRPALTTRQPPIQVAAAPITTTVAVTATTSLTATTPTTTNPTSTAATTLAVADASLGGDAANGKVLFATTCAACHGPNGEGVKGLGKDMTASPFIASLSDPDLLAFVKRGRDTGDPLNTTGVMMPPKGGNPTLDDAKLTDIIAFMRSLQKPISTAAALTTTETVTTTAIVTAPATVTTTVPSTPTALTATTNPTATTAAPAAEVVLTGAAANGKTLFATTCAACHGPNGEGVKGLGKDMTTSAFIASLSDADLLAFIKVGRASGDPLNTTGVMMPPKGGNPTLDDAKIMEIIAFMRAIQKP